MTPNQDVILGGLPLMLGGMDYESLDGYKLRVAADGATLGSPESITSVLLSMLSNGSIVVRQRDENRQPSFVVEVCAEHDDGLALARGEEVLRSVVGRPVELEWRPPQTGSPVAVFDILHSSMQLLYSDTDELNQYRAYQVTLSALPYARSKTVTTFDALPLTGSTTVVPINTADATTGWTSALPVTDVGTALRFTTGAQTLYGALTIPAGTLTGLPIVIVEYRHDPGQPLNDLTIRVEPYQLAGPVLTQAIDTEWRRAYFRLTSPSSATDLTFSLPNVSTWFEIRDVSATATAPVIGGGFQQTNTFEIGGSETTQGSIDVEHATTNLGDVIVYTRPADGTPYQPSLQPFIFTSTTYRSTEATAVSGFKWNLLTSGGAIGCLVPAAAIPPGDYHLVVRIKNTENSAAYDLNVKTSSRPFTALSIGDITRKVRVAAAPINTWVFRSLGTYTLPIVRVGAFGNVNLEIFQDVSGTPDLLLDDIWLFKADGALTIVEGVVMPNLRIIAPSLAEPGGTVWSSNDTDFNEAYTCTNQCMSRQHHDLKPGSNLCHVVSTGVAKPEVSATAYKRWNNYPAA